jgi:hypothetical protein
MTLLELAQRIEMVDEDAFNACFPTIITIFY